MYIYIEIFFDLYEYLICMYVLYTCTCARSVHRHLVNTAAWENRGSKQILIWLGFSLSFVTATFESP